MTDPAITLSRHGHATGLRIQLAGAIARTVRIEPKAVTFDAEQLGRIDEDFAPIWWNRLRVLVGVGMVRRGRWPK